MILIRLFSFKLISMISLLAMFSLCDLNAMELQTEEKAADCGENAVHIDDLMLVHVTNVRPSISNYGTSLVLKTGGSSYSAEKTSDEKIFVGPRDFSRPSRTTLHWSLNGVTRIAGWQDKNGKITYGVPARYVILEPISSLKDSLWGGGFDDMYSIGDHTISKSGYLIVPEDEPGIDNLANYVSLVRIGSIPDGLTNEDLRALVEEVLKIIGKPVMIANGILFDEQSLSIIFKVSLPSSWSSMDINELSHTKEFRDFNVEKLGEAINGILNAGDKRLFICKEFSQPYFEPIAAFQMPNNKVEIMDKPELRKILENSEYALPELATTHPRSKLQVYEKKLSESYDNGNTIALVHEIRLYIEDVYKESKRLSVPQGFYSLLNRIEEQARIQAGTQTRSCLSFKDLYNF